MKVHFCKSNNLGGFIIRLFTFSRWNHVALEIDGIVWEATARRGVAPLYADRYEEYWDNVETIEISDTGKYNARDFLRCQFDKKYDWMAIFALPFRTDWQKEDRWFCSELVAAALLRGGHKSFRKENHRITPDNLWVAL
jgi:hypothetical protein